MSDTALTGRRLDAVAGEIRAYTASMLTNVIEIGRRFAEAKSLLPYGEFGDWVSRETGYSVSTAGNFMRLFEEYGAAQGTLFGAVAESQTIGKLPYTKALALLALPSGEREEFAETNNVKAMSVRELKQVIKERDEERASAESAAMRVGELEEKLRALKSKLERTAAERETLKARTDELSSALTELENRPLPDIRPTVEPDGAALEQAREAGRVEAEERLRAEIDAAQAAQREAETRIKALTNEKSEAETKLEALKSSASKELKEAVRAEKERADKLERSLKLAGSGDAAEFKVRFASVQSEWSAMLECIARVTDAGDAELSAKLRGAARALAARFAEEAEG